MPQVIKEKNKSISLKNPGADTSGDNQPTWFANLREKASERYEQLDFPTTHDEEWKYTNISPILKVPYQQTAGPAGVTAELIEPFTFEESRQTQLVFINGRFSSELSNLSGLADGIIVSNLANALAEHPKLVSGYLGAYAGYQDEVFTALNTAQISDGAFIYVSKIIENPIHLLFFS